MHFHQAPATRQTAAAPRFLCYRQAPPKLGVLNFNHHTKPQIPKNSSRPTAKKPARQRIFCHLNRGNSEIKFKNRASAGPERRPPPPPRGGTGASPAQRSGASRRIPARSRARGHGPAGRETTAVGKTRLRPRWRKRERKRKEARPARPEYQKVPRGSAQPLSSRSVTAAGFLLPQVPGGAALGNIPTPSPAPPKPSPSPTPAFPLAPLPPTGAEGTSPSPSLSTPAAQRKKERGCAGHRPVPPRSRRHQEKMKLVQALFPSLPDALPL
ncbi:predicted GPI-anchored protein 58 [Corvus moneduloides]|uniref:predicted GPI-anchored protein 58 n=1 Tax=Corvus moneduloides TaxID=1196302 RepID=UPI0013636B6E|nr:predicted GPI-anchored protein 58 [Corvus moneduloides]